MIGPGRVLDMIPWICNPRYKMGIVRRITVLCEMMAYKKKMVACVNPTERGYNRNTMATQRKGQAPSHEDSCSFWDRQEFRKADARMGPYSELTPDSFYEAREDEDRRDPACGQCPICRELARDQAEWEWYHGTN